MKQKIENIINTNLIVNKSLIKSTANIERAALLVANTYKNNGKLLLCGNGGSAADSQHIATEFVSRFYKDRQALPALALTVNTSVLTSCGNDYDFKLIFKRQVEALAQPNDCLIAISTSGKSANVIEASREARKRNCSVISLVGNQPTNLVDLSDIIIAVPSSDTPRIQESHILIGHIICQLVEEIMFSDEVSLVARETN